MAVTTRSIRRGFKRAGTVKPSNYSQLFQMTVTDVPRTGVPSITIAKWNQAAPLFPPITDSCSCNSARHSVG